MGQGDSRVRAAGGCWNEGQSLQASDDSALHGERVRSDPQGADDLSTAPTQSSNQPKGVRGV